MSKEAGVIKGAWIVIGGFVALMYAFMIEWAHEGLGLDYAAGIAGAIVCGLATAGWVWWMARKGKR